MKRLGLWKKVKRAGWGRERLLRIILLAVIAIGVVITLIALLSPKRDVYFSIRQMIEHHEFKKVEELTGKLHQLNPADVRTLRLMGINYYLQGLKFESRQGITVDAKSRYRTDHFQQPQGEEGWVLYKKAVESMKKAILADKQGIINSRDYMIIGFSYSRWGDSHFSQALEFLDKSEALNRKDKALDNSDLSAFSLESLYRQRGYLHYRKGDYTNALRDFGLANNIDRKVLNYLYIAHSAKALDMTNEAIRNYTRVIDYSRDRTIRTSCLEMLGSIHLQARQYDKAGDYFRRAVAISSNSASGYFGLSLVAEAQGKQAEARKYWELTLKADPHYGPAILRMRNRKDPKAPR